MRIGRTDRRGASDDHLLPMINVVFLLLIFFLVVGTIRPPAPLETDPPESLADRQIEGEARIHLASDGRLAVGEDVVSLDELFGRVRNIRSADDGPLLRIGVRADGDVDLGQLYRVFDALSEAGIREVELMTVRASDTAR